MFEHVEAYPGDPILSLNESFKTDPRANKINLSIGVYLDEQGRLPVMHAVREAETALLQNIGPRPYLPMDGLAAYRKAVQHLLFGAGHRALEEGRVATIQTLGGSGALRVGGDFLHAYFAGRQVWISDPTWDNHRAIFQGAGFEVKAYRYYDPATKQADFAGMQNALETMAEGSIVVMHACCHNPTGADLSQDQWRTLAQLAKRRKLLPFFDIAYQGFGDGLDEDAFPLRHFANEGLQFLVAGSLSKNFSLYGERCGSLSVVCGSKEQAQNVHGQLQSAVRRNYSSPPTHGGRIVASVLENPQLRAMWQEELDGMRVRIRSMREGLHAALVKRKPGHDFDYVLKQHGMFSYTGLSPQQVARLREEFAVYLVGTGRICLAALTPSTIEPSADAIAQVLE